MRTDWRSLPPAVADGESLGLPTGKDADGRSCGRVGTPKEHPLRKVEASGEPIRRKAKWSGSRFGGGENGTGADIAEG